MQDQFNSKMLVLEADDRILTWRDVILEDE